MGEINGFGVEGGRRVSGKEYRHYLNPSLKLLRQSAQGHRPRIEEKRDGKEAKLCPFQKTSRGIMVQQ